MTDVPPISADQIRIRKLFPTPLVLIQHPEAVSLNDRLRKVILAHEASHAGVSHSNDGGWQSTDDFVGWAGEAGSELLAFVKQAANTISTVWDPVNGLFEANIDWTYNAWANVNRSGHANAAHTHPGSYWTSVYWVDDGGAGDNPRLGGQLELIDPRGAMPAMLSPHLRAKIEDCLTAGFTEEVTPRSGTLALFPSWLYHSVTRFRGERPRISIAINLAPPMG